MKNTSTTTYKQSTGYCTHCGSASGSGHLHEQKECRQHRQQKHCNIEFNRILSVIPEQNVATRRIDNLNNLNTSVKEREKSVLGFEPYYIVVANTKCSTDMSTLLL